MDTTTAIETLAMERLNVSPERLRSATTFDEAGIDSLSAIDLIFAIEAHFEIYIDADELIGVNSLSDLIAIVNVLASKAAHPQAHMAGQIE
jgi:acyl carrier protein